MCDDHTVEDNEEYLRGQGKLTRREFGTLAAGAGLAAMLPRVANARSVSESDVAISTPDGSADAYFVHPQDEASAAVLVWPDIVGLRPAFRAMGKRLAESGYATLVVNPYYRKAKAPVVEEGASFANPETRAKLLPLAGSLSAETCQTDAKAFVDWLDAQAAVDKKRKIGTTGYCMGGPIVMRTAAARADRIGAAASFHGGRLVTDAENSPHLLIPEMKASFLIAIAANDHEREPETKGILEQAYTDAGLPAEIEVYEGAMHGWCPPDSPVYDEAKAERAWSRMLALFEKALA